MTNTFFNFSFQMVCKYIFVPYWENSFKGLLTGLPYQLQLTVDQIISKCLNLVGPMTAKTNIVFHKLQSILQQSLGS